MSILHDAGPARNFTDADARVVVRQPYTGTTVSNDSEAFWSVLEAFERAEASLRRPWSCTHRLPKIHCGCLAAGSLDFRTRVPAVARELGYGAFDLLSERDRGRLIAAIFDPRIAPATERGSS